jgi:beta-phosphoglucomutase-like phosphatase (HAD superfamily)
MIRAVVFDCDGVLVDSEPHSWAAWRTVAARHGHALTDEDVAACTGLSYADTHAHLTSLVGGTLPGPDALLPEVLEALQASYATGLHRFGDAVGAAAELAFEGVPLAVASSSVRPRLDLTLEAADLRRYFDVTVAGDEVAAGKPAPDVYLRAAELLGARPRNCVAVEDSGPGAAAALAAGMRVIGVARDVAQAARLVDVGAGVVGGVDAPTIRLLLGI